MRKFSDINESVWGDVRRRADGSQDRKEDNLNNMGREDLYKYMLNHYTSSEHHPLTHPNKIATMTDPIITEHITESDKLDVIMVTAYQDEDEGFHYIIYNHVDSLTPVVEFSIKRSDDMFDILDEKFSIVQNGTKAWNMHICPKDGSNITHTFFLMVLDTILEAANEDETLKTFIKKI